MRLLILFSLVNNGLKPKVFDEVRRARPSRLFLYQDGPRGERPNLLPEFGAVGKNVDAAAHRGADSAQTGDESGERRSLGRLSEELHRIRCDHAGFDRPYAGA